MGRSVALIAAGRPTAELHDRMPVILGPADHDAWLDPADPRGAGLLRPCLAE